MAGGLLLTLLIGAVVLILVEGRRQRKKYGPSSGTALLKTGLLEMQSFLEPEKKIEILREERPRSVQEIPGGPGSRIEPEQGRRIDPPSRRLC